MLKKTALVLASLFCVVMLAGCDEDARLQKAAPKEADAVAREFFTALNKKNTDQAEKLIEPKIRAEAKEKLKNLADLLAVGTPEKVQVVGIRVRQDKDQKLVQLNYQISFSQAWVVASLAILENPQGRHIFSVRMDPLKEPLEKIYAFKFFGKSFFHYVVLLFALAVPLFIIYVGVQCFRYPMAWKWKWIWLLFIALAFLPVYLDWTGGRAFIRLLGVLILGVSFMKVKYGPLVLAVGIPVGALVFYFKYLFRKSAGNKPAAASF
jgi:hypothetical protein